MNSFAPQMNGIDLSWIDQQIEVFQALIEQTNSAKSSFESKTDQEYLEECFSLSAINAELAEKKTDILCVIDQIKEFIKAQRFYELSQAITHAVDLIDEYASMESPLRFEVDIHQTLIDGLEAYNSFLNKVKAAFRCITSLQGDISYGKLNRFVNHLEILAELLEFNHPFFSYEALVVIEHLSVAIIESCREDKGKYSIQSKTETNRRRLRYAAGFILNLFDDLEIETEREEKQVRSALLSLVELD